MVGALPERKYLAICSSKACAHGSRGARPEIVAWVWMSMATIFSRSRLGWYLDICFVACGSTAGEYSPVCCAAAQIATPESHHVSPDSSPCRASREDCAFERIPAHRHRRGLRHH